MLSGDEIRLRLQAFAARWSVHGIGLTKLYNLVDEGGFRALATLHRDLDEAVAACYGWPAAVAHDADESDRRLLALNAEIARGERPYAPFG